MAFTGRNKRGQARAVAAKARLGKPTYSAEGVVQGNLWMGGKAYYAAKKVSGDSLPELHKKVAEGVDSGTLDSGMGFNGLNGAFMAVTKKTKAKIKGKEFLNEEVVEPIVVGDIDEGEAADAYYRDV
jgi:hypothetical protein